LLGHYGLRMATVIVLSTWVGLGVTALVLRALMHGEGLDAGSAAVDRDTA
jgi:putative effector of murein hydrolase LrgA (UPF0299 family)